MTDNLRARHEPLLTEPLDEPGGSLLAPEQWEVVEQAAANLELLFVLALTVACLGMVLVGIAFVKAAW